MGLEHIQHLVTEDPEHAQQQVQAVMSGLNQTIHDIRNYIFDLQVVEQTQELEGVLENLVHDLRLDTLMEVELEVRGTPCCVPGSQLMAHLTQIAREALSNVVQHAQATKVLVALHYEEQEIKLIVTDDGAGIGAMGVEGGEGNGYGLSNMQARARLMGGELILAGMPEGGTQMVLTVACGMEESYDG